jgi:hypothetical protein
MHLGTSRYESFGARIAASETEDLVARVDEFRNKSRTDKTCGTGYENTHSISPLRWFMDKTAFAARLLSRWRLGQYDLC